MADTLKTNYVDDVLDTSVNETRVYDIVDAQGNVVASNIHLEERTVYSRNGDKYGADDVNATNKALTDETHGVSFQFGIDGHGDYGYIKDGETAVTPFKSRHTETYKPTVRANNNDMGLYHKKRYVDTTEVPNTNSGTQTINAVYTSGNGLDLGANNSVRYIKTSGLMKTPTATKSITANGNNQDVLNYAKVNVNVVPNVWIGSTDTPTDTISQTVCTINSPHTNSILKAAIVWNESFNPSSSNSYVQVKNPSGTVLYTYKPPASDCNLKVSQISLTLAATGNHTIYAYSNSSDGYIKVAMAVVY